MWIEAILTARDCADFVASITPLSFDLGSPDRMLVIERPKDVEIVAQKGLRLRTAGHVVWTVAGLRVPISARIASLLLAPTIESKNGRDALALKVRVEKLDVNVLPDFIDETVLHRINDMLAKHDEALVWRFTKTLSRYIRLPQRIESAEGVDLQAKWGQLKITEEGIALAISLHATAVKSGPKATAHAAE